MSMKKQSFIVLMLSILLLLAACGNAREKEIPADQAQEASAEETKAPSTAETVEDMEYTLTGYDWKDDGSTEEYKRTGTYSGDVVDGVPNGVGSFTTVNSKGITWVYTGEFLNGTFHGQGGTVWNAPEFFCSEKGTYTDGLYTPTKAEFYDMIERDRTNDNGRAIEPTAYAFLADHEQLFPCTSVTDREETEKYLRGEVSYSDLKGKLSQYTVGLVMIRGLTVTWADNDFWNGYDYTRCTAQDINGDKFNICHLGTTVLEEGDAINVVGLPVAESYFVNGGGESISAIMIAACYFE